VKQLEDGYAHFMAMSFFFSLS